MRLSSTSYAILGQLAFRDWTTYELAKQLHRNLRYFWPRAESRIYDEAKRLVAQGLATAEEGFVGRRRRTTYRITSKGRRALTRWLEEPAGRSFSLEFEGLLRVFLAPVASKEAMLATLDRVASDAEDVLDTARTVGTEYLEGRAPFQNQVHVRAFVFDYLTSHALGIREWAERTKAEVESWPDMSPPDASERALETIRAGMKRIGPGERRPS